jgi:NADPH:quinone reductase-like Zn-dependent oxidoreductase
MSEARAEGPGGWIIDGRFGLDALRWRSAPPPAPGPGELRLRLRAMSLNFRDLLMVTGRYNPRQPLPLVPGSDAVGVVEAVGEGVVGWSVGDRATPLFCSTWLAGPVPAEATAGTLGGPLPGVFQTHRCLPARALLRPPAHLSDAEVATLPCAGVTAWRALFTEGRLLPGQTLLTIGTGGVSLFAVQLGRLAGARVLLVTRSRHKAAAAEALGAEVIVDAGEAPGWAKAVRAATGGQGVDRVVELGGAGTLAQSIAATKAGGTIALIGVLDGVVTTLPLTSIFMRGLRLQGIMVGSGEDHAALHAALAAHPSLRPVIHARWPLSALPEALAALGEGQHLGKLVLEAP